MIRRLPVIPTIIVAAAVAVMIGLGVWQLQRAGWKERLLARYARAETLPPIAWPTAPLKADERPLFRHATGVCLRPIGRRAVAGENRAGVYTGVWTAGETLGLALGPALFALVLALGGYVSSQGRTIEQPESAQVAIVLGFSVVPALLVLASLWWLRRYSLDAAQVAAAELAVESTGEGGHRA